MAISKSALAEVERAFEEYCQVMLASGLSEATKGIYVDRAECFIRWMKGEYTPRAHLSPFPLKRNREASENVSD